MFHDDPTEKFICVILSVYLLIEFYDA